MMLEKLTEHDEYGNADIIGVDSVELQLNLKFDELNRVTDALNRLAAYEDSGLSPEEITVLKTSEKICEDCWNYALAQKEGRLIVLPCKIGEKVYRYCNDAINEGTIINILLNVKTGEIGLEYDMPTCYTCSRSGTLGKNLFLAREAAEKALKEGLK